MNKTIVTTYKLEALDEQGNVVTIEEATPEHPFKFISGMGFALDSFEEKVTALEEGDTFDFTLDPEDAYGPYDETHVIEFDKDMFCVDGRLDTERIHPGANVPLVNDDGQRFIGHVLEVGSDKVKVDLNDTLAGKRIRFTGTVIISRPATNKEIEGMINLLNGEECGCGCGHDGHECKHGHEHKHGGHECCHDQQHDHKDGHCCKHHQH